MTVGEKVCVSPRRMPRELPNSAPAPKPEGRSLPLGDEPSGKLLSRSRSLVSRLTTTKNESESLKRWSPRMPRPLR